MSIDHLAGLLSHTTLDDSCSAWVPPKPHKGLLTQQRRLRYLLVMDVEATCDEQLQVYPHEVIELPVILLDLEARKTLAYFHHYVRPTKQPKLSPFCTELTGITQETVDAADTFPEVLGKLTVWLEQQGMRDMFDPPLTECSITHPPQWYPHTSAGKDIRYQRHFRNWAFATDGLADIEKFLWLQTRHNGISLPAYFHGPYVDTRGLFANFMKTARCTLAEQARMSGVTMQGQAHSGLDDTRNIASICLALQERGCTFGMFGQVNASQG